MTNEEKRELLRQRCDKIGQSACARAIGVTQPYIHQILTGKKPMSDRVLRQLGVDIEYKRRDDSE